MCPCVRNAEEGLHVDAKRREVASFSNVEMRCEEITALPAAPPLGPMPDGTFRSGTASVIGSGWKRN